MSCIGVGYWHNRIKRQRREVELEGGEVGMEFAGKEVE